MSKTRIGFGLAAAALAIAGCATAADMNKTAAADQVQCYGVHSCKGQADCKTAENACKGQNACKGHGFKMMGKKACMDAGGKTEM